MASGHMNRVKRPDTWLHRPRLQNVKKVLANPEPSTHDPSATLAGSKFRSAAVSYATVVCAIFDIGSTWASSASVDSEQFRSIPRTCWSLCRRFSVRQADQRRQGERNARCLA